MSLNQSRAEKCDEQLKKPGRSGSSSQQQRSFFAGKGGGGTTLAASSSSSANRRYSLLPSLQYIYRVELVVLSNGF